MAPLPKGGRGGRGYGLPRAQSALAMTHCKECGISPVRAVGEIGKALPVADEASRFRGSAPIGGHDGGQENPAHSHNIGAFATGDRKGRPYGCMSPKIFVGVGYSSG